MSIGSSEKGGPYDPTKREKAYLPGMDYRKGIASIRTRLRI